MSALSQELAARLKGDKGDPGERGEKGDPGERGEKGEQGERGYRGEQGERGERGEKGERGERGEDGAPGRDGKDGARGPQGLPGPMCVRSEFQYGAGQRLEAVVEWMSDGSQRILHVQRNAAGRPVGLTHG